MLSYVEHERSFITLGPGILELFSFVKISKIKLFNLGFQCKHDQACIMKKQILILWILLMSKCQKITHKLNTL